MIDVYYWPTPNCKKVTILLEELQLPYQLHRVDINSGAQKSAPFLEINPNGRVPAIVDNAPSTDGRVVLAESGAILLYLAEKVGRLLPSDTAGRVATLQWLFWQMSALGPMQGQASHFLNSAPEPIPYAIERFRNEVDRLYGVMEHQLSERKFLCGDMGVADIACYPWVALHERGGIDLNRFPSILRWHRELSAREAFQRGMQPDQSSFCGGVSERLRSLE